MRHVSNLLLLATLGVIGCGGGTVAPPPPPPLPPPPPAPVASVALTPAGPISLQVGGISQLSAAPKDAAGNALSGRPVTWSSSADAVASVSGSGLVTAASAGTAQIIATSEGVSGQAAVTVTPVPVATVALSTGAATLVPNQPLTLAAMPKDAAGNPLVGRAVTWSSSADGIASVSQAGVITGVAVGSATITALSEGKSAQAAITVVDGGWLTPAGGTVTAAGGKVVIVGPAGAVAQSIAIRVAPVAAPASADSVVAGTIYDFAPNGTQFLQLVTLKITYAAASIPAGKDPALFKIRHWSGQRWEGLSAGGDIADVGTRTITGKVTSFSEYGVGCCALVTDIVSATVSPGSASLAPAETRQLSSTFKDGNGTVLPLSAQWTSSAQAMATVNQNGLVTAISQGQTTIRAGTGGSGSGVTFVDAVITVSPPQSRLAFSRKALGQNSEIHLINTDGSNPVNLTNGASNDFGVAWSRDGTKLAFVSQRSGGGSPNEVYVMAADGSNVVRLTNRPGDDSEPNWAPDGGSLAFATDRDGHLQIYRMNSDGTNPVNLSNNTASDSKPDWAPDGGKLAFIGLRNGNLDIYVMNADGSGQVRLTNDPGFDGTPKWSPDGTKIAFPSDRGGRFSIYVMNADGSNVVRLTNNAGADDGYPTWSPDGTKIGFTRDITPQIGDLYVMNADGTNVIRITNNADNPGQPVRSAVPAWKPRE